VHTRRYRFPKPLALANSATARLDSSFDSRNTMYRYTAGFRYTLSRHHRHDGVSPRSRCCAHHLKRVTFLLRCAPTRYNGHSPQAFVAKMPCALGHAKFAAAFRRLIGSCMPIWSPPDYARYFSPFNGCSSRSSDNEPIDIFSMSDASSIFWDNGGTLNVGPRTRRQARASAHGEYTVVSRRTCNAVFGPS